MHPTRTRSKAWRLLPAAVCALGLFATGPSHGGDWPQFQGPDRNAVSPETGLNWDWKGSPPKVLWKVPLGSGYSSLAIIGDRLYTTAKRGNRDFVVCLDAKDGREAWSYDAAPTYLDKQRQGAGPRATPVLHDGKLYCLFGMGELICLTADGKRIWEVNIFRDTGARSQAGEFYYWGVSFSPLVEGDLVIVQPGGTKGNSVAAYHRETGKRVWMAGDDPLGYASPIAITVDKQRIIVCPTGRSILGLDPTKGTVLWRYAFGNQFNATGATPVWKDNVLFVSAAYGAGSAALELTPSTDRWRVRAIWQGNKNLQSLFATPIVLDGQVYACHGDLSAFQLRCLDLKTGKESWSERVSERYSLLGVDKHLLVWGERGSLIALNATPDAFTVVGELPNLLTYKSWAMPALADGRLYLRDEKQALCLDLRRP
jgi:outer membrane protein assembly factor BamB